MLGFEHTAAMLLTAVFPVIVAAVIYRHFGGWASKAQFLIGGALSTLVIVVTIALNQMIGSAFAPPHEEVVRFVFWEHMFHAALPEEAAKLVGLLALHYLLLTRDPREFLVGAAAIGLGFGVFENIEYFTGARNAVAIGALRGVLTAPIHMGLALISAAGVWRWRDAGGSIFDMLACVALSVLLHASYNSVVTLWRLAITDSAPLGAGPVLQWLLAVLCVALIAGATMIALIAIDLFRRWCADAPSHDLLHRHGLAHGRAAPWLAHTPVLVRGAAIMLTLSGAACALSPSGILVTHAPTLIGVGLSLELWSRAIRRWEAAPV